MKNEQGAKDWLCGILNDETLDKEFYGEKLKSFKIYNMDNLVMDLNNDGSIVRYSFRIVTKVLIDNFQFGAKETDDFVRKVVEDQFDCKQRNSLISFY